VLCSGVMKLDLPPFRVAANPLRAIADNVLRLHSWCRQFNTFYSSHTVSSVMYGVWLAVLVCNKIQTRWSLVRKRTIPTERPPLVDEI
jgi:hypothetical protein